MYCSQCGWQLGQSYSYCTRCGHKVKQFCSVGPEAYRIQPKFSSTQTNIRYQVTSTTSGVAYTAALNPDSSIVVYDSNFMISGTFGLTTGNVNLVSKNTRLDFQILETGQAPINMSISRHFITKCVFNSGYWQTQFVWKTKEEARKILTPFSISSTEIDNNLPEKVPCQEVFNGQTCAGVLIGDRYIIVNNNSFIRFMLLFSLLVVYSIPISEATKTAAINSASSAHYNEYVARKRREDLWFWIPALIIVGGIILYAIITVIVLSFV